MATAKRKKNDAASVIPQGSHPTPIATEHDIAERAYALYLERGAEDGHDLDDWLQAEQELRLQSSPKPS
jgi:hypothetical protein